MASFAAPVRHLLGVQSSKPQQTSQVDHLLLIHLQRYDGGAPSRCQADKQGKVVAPHKMFGPALFPRVEEGHESTVEGISTFDLIIFVTVTRWAGQGEIIQPCAPTFGPRHNMLYSKRTRHKAVRSVTVLTASSRTCKHGLSLGRRDPFRLHTPVV
jgi:hypothetical protein